MIYYFFLAVELFALFILSQMITRYFSRIILTVIPSQRFMIAIFAILFLPGVIIHELAHFLSAVALLVKVGEMEFFPKLHGSSLKLGSVEVARTDPLRRAVIGFAPVFVGMVVLFALVKFIGLDFSKFWQTIGVGYLLFVVSNTMFSSKKDVEGTVEFLIALVVVLLIIYILGFRAPFASVYQFLADNSIVAKILVLALLPPLVIDALVAFSLKLLL